MCDFLEDVLFSETRVKAKWSLKLRLLTGVAVAIVLVIITLLFFFLNEYKEIGVFVVLIVSALVFGRVTKSLGKNEIKKEVIDSLAVKSDGVHTPASFFPWNKIDRIEFTGSYAMELHHPKAQAVANVIGNVGGDMDKHSTGSFNPQPITKLTLITKSGERIKLMEPIKARKFVEAFEKIGKQDVVKALPHF